MNSPLICLLLLLCQRLANLKLAAGQDSSGADASEAHLSPPIELEAIRLNNTSVVLKWNIAYAAQDQLQFFKILHKSTRKGAQWKTEPKEIAPSARATQINGLRPGNYFFTVSAVYSNDDNVSSEQLKFQLRAGSKIPADQMPEQTAPKIYWSFAESDYFRFKWTYKPKEEDFNYHGFLVYFRTTHAVVDFTIHATFDNGVEITDVEPETPYEAKVVAYNQHTVSEFSDLIRITTLAKSNATTTASPPQLATTVASVAQPASTSGPGPSSTTSTTRAPSASSAPQPAGPALVELDQQSTNSSKLVQQHQKPANTSLIINQVTPINHNHNNATSTSPRGTFHSLYSIIELVFGQQTSDFTLAIRYSLLILLPLSCILSTTVCLISCHRRNKDKSPPATPESMQFDLEINSYFKNSFPGVEKEFSTVITHHQGFVNNHPSIDDFT